MTIRAVHHLNCATMCPVAAKWLLGVDRMVAHCLLLETERDGLVLVDTGFGTRDVDGRTKLSAAFRRLVGPSLDRAETAVAQVAALGHSPADVRHLVVTHLDRLDTVHGDAPRDPDAWLDFVEAMLGAPVAIASSGPRARDKR